MSAASEKSPVSHAASVLVAGFCILLLVQPEAALSGGRHGFDIFIRIVFPSLLPFFIVSELMIGLGLVRFLGAFLEPLMRPLFHVPGVGAFAFSMGLAAGYPMDAVITTKLRKSGLCTRVEGERILAFSNTADPLFILGAVGVGMFHDPKVGVALAVGHYLSTLIVGLLFRLHGSREGLQEDARRARRRKEEQGRGGLLAKAVREMIQARREDGRHLGKLLADSVEESIRTLLNICGFIMLFSALVSLLGATGLMSVLVAPVSAVLQLIGWDPAFAQGVVAGIFELDIGSAAVAAAEGPLYQGAALVGGIIAWSGLSVHGQVASIIAGTDLRLSVYMFGRALHGVLGAMFTYAYARWAWSASPGAGATVALGVDAWLTLGLFSLAAALLVTGVAKVMRRA